MSSGVRSTEWRVWPSSAMSAVAGSPVCMWPGGSNEKPTMLPALSAITVTRIDRDSWLVEEIREDKRDVKGVRVCNREQIDGPAGEPIGIAANEFDRRRGDVHRLIQLGGHWQYDDGPHVIAAAASVAIEC